MKSGNIISGLAMMAMLTGCGRCTEEYYEKSLRFPEGISAEEKVEMAARVIPTAKQLQWQQMELTAFLHFGINTFTGNEWGNGTDSPEIFNPSSLDCRQWAKTLKEGGFRMAILTAKHHDGFCLWQTSTTDYSVKNSPWMNGQGDVVKELSEACREYGLKFGVYLSPWDRNAGCYGDSPAYNQFFINQLTELLTNYGQVHEVWFDGACAEGPNGRRQVYDWTAILETIHKLQPEAVTAIMGDDVRWVGNEGGRGRETEWSATAYTPLSLERGPEQNRALGLVEMSRDLGSRELIAKAQEVSWYPSEVDVSIRPGWFYHPYQDSQVRTLENLVDIYYTSVGRNSVLLLNIPPDTRGLIHEIDAQRLKDLRSYLDETFDENLLVRRSRLWKAEEGDTREFEVKDGAVFNTLLIREDITKGQRTEAFTLEAFAGGHWTRIAEGTTIGYNRLLKFPATTAEKIRITIVSTRKTALISEVGLFYAPEVKDNAYGEDIPHYADQIGWKSLTSGAETAFDGKASTAWKAESLADLAVDMGKLLEFKGFVYTPETGHDLTGTIFRYDFAVSQDGMQWQTIITDGEFSNIMHNPVPYEVHFEQPLAARYFRLTPLQEITGKQVTSVGEIAIIR